MKFLCWSYTIVELSACKTRGHFRTFPRYFDSLTQKASRLLLITTITVNQWILDLYDGTASRVEKILALKPLCGKRWSSVFIRWRSKSLFRALSVHQWWKMRQNQWLELPNWYAASQNEQTLCRRQTRCSGKQAAKRLLAAKKIEMHDPRGS